MMYGLFKNSYDYYEWHDLIAVSESKDKLIEKAKESEYPLLDGIEQENARDGEEYHLVIEEVELL